MPVLRSLFLLPLLALSLGAHAQGGIRALLVNYEPVVTGFGAEVVHYGLGYDADLNDRLSMRVQWRTTPGLSSWVVNYHSNYHFSDNTSSSFYLGPHIGVRVVGGPDGATLVPVGMRMGVRGGLEGFYADLHIGGHYNVGGGGRVRLENVGTADLRTLSFCGGLDIGFGWARKKKW